MIACGHAPIRKLFACATAILAVNSVGARARPRRPWHTVNHGSTLCIHLPVDGGVGRVGGADADVVVSFAFVGPADEPVEHAIDALAARSADGAAVADDGFEREWGIYGA